MLNTKKIIFLIILVILTLTSIKPAMASLKLSDAPAGIQTTAGAAGISTASSLEIAIAITKTLLTLFGTIFLLLIIYGGYSWLISSASPDKVAKAKKIITNAVIGLAIVILAYSIASFIANALETDNQPTQTQETTTQ